MNASAMDGDGWVVCATGHRHWGRHGAAGLLLVSVGDDGIARILLQHRAPWTHHGDTWGVPGGARASWETSAEAALRETAEETDLPLDGVQLDREYEDDHGGWAYVTVIGRLPKPLNASKRNEESVAFKWWPINEVDGLALHPGFSMTWPELGITP